MTFTGTPEQLTEQLKTQFLNHRVTDTTKPIIETTVSALETLCNWAEEDEFIHYFEPYLAMHPNVGYAMLTNRQLIELAARILIPDETERRDAFCTLDLSVLLH